jgi:hypothetical protein
MIGILIIIQRMRWCCILPIWFTENTSNLEQHLNVTVKMVMRPYASSNTRHKDVWGSGGRPMAPGIHNVFPRWICLVSFHNTAIYVSKILVGKPEGKRHLRDLDEDGG